MRIHHAQRVLVGAGILSALLFLSKPFWESLCASARYEPVCLVQAGVDLSAHLLFLLGLIGLFVAYAANSGWLGGAGFLVSFLGAALVVGVKWMRLFVQPWLLDAVPHLSASAPPALLRTGLGLSFGLGGLGLVLLAAGFWRARIGPGWGVLLVLLSVAAEAFVPHGYVLAQPLLGLWLLLLCLPVMRRPRLPSEAPATLIPAA
jgi:hypothetical protein